MSSNGINRRDFLIASASAAVAALPGLANPADGRPGPQGGPGAANRSEKLPRLSLVSRAPSGTHAWTFGQVFAQGDVPPGQFLTSGHDGFQADVRNRWPDGSAKFAVLSGIGEFVRHAPKPVEMRLATAVEDAPTVPERDALDVSITFGGSVDGTYSLQSALGRDKEQWDGRAGPGRVRSIPGPVMSEFHYFVPTSDAHVSVWFFVRCYANGATEIETVVENGWMFVPAPDVREYTVVLAIGRLTRFAGSVSHRHHSRWSRVDWLATDPQIRPRHDPAYLRGSRLVPNYGYTAPSAAAFERLLAVDDPEPFAIGNWPNRMGAAGHSPHIGLLPSWEALYCTSADERAYVATMANGRCAGRYAIHYRDESTGRVPLPSAYPNLTLTSGSGREAPPKASGGEVPGGWAISHHPSIGFLAYVLSGRWSMLESLQFSAAFALLQSRPATRQGGRVLACMNAPLTTRGSAWAWRTMGQAAAISPTMLAGTAAPAADLAVQEQAAASIADTATWMRRRYVEGSIDHGIHRNSVGWLGQYDGSSKKETKPEWWGAGWQARFQSLALAHISDLGIENLERPEDLVAVRNHSYEGALQLIGDDSSWNWRRMALYRQPYLKNGSRPAAPVFMSTSEAFAAYRARYGLADLSSAPGRTLKEHSSDQDIKSGSSSNVATGYGAFAAAVLAMAVDHGRPGAREKYELVRTARNFDPARAGANDEPTWAIVPR